MNLYLVQHGQATSKDEDPARPLTSQGVDDVSRVARYAVDDLDVHVARVVHSGKTRALQTAELWGKSLGADVEQADGLAPKDDPAVWAERLRDTSVDTMLVGHLPFLERLASMLVAGDPDRPVVEFRPGGLAGLEHADDGWVVSLLLPPGRR